MMEEGTSPSEQEQLLNHISAVRTDIKKHGLCMIDADHLNETLKLLGIKERIDIHMCSLDKSLIGVPKSLSLINLIIKKLGDSNA